MMMTNTDCLPKIWTNSGHQEVITAKNIWTEQSGDNTRKDIDGRETGKQVPYNQEWSTSIDDTLLGFLHTSHMQRVHESNCAKEV